MNEIARQAHLAVTLAEDVVPRIGDAPLTKDDMRLLSERTRIFVTKVPMDGAMLCAPRFRGVTRLTLSERQPFSARRWLACREYAAGLLGLTEPNSSCGLFALLCVLSHAERDLLGQSWEDRVVADVRAITTEINDEVQRVAHLLPALRTSVRDRRAGVVTMSDVVERDDAEWLYEVGRLAKCRGEWARAESYFTKALALGAESGDWHAVALAHDGMGLMRLERGQFTEAAECFGRAVEVASRFSLRSALGSAHHDLLSVAIARRQLDAAIQHGRKALAAYPPEHHRIPALAHDIAYVWLEQGLWGRALRVFEAVAPHIRRPADVVCLWGSICRAAAGAGLRDPFMQGWRVLWEQTLERADRENLAHALTSAAEGALALGDFGAARDAAEAAKLIAERRGEAFQIHRAEGVLGRVQASEAPNTNGVAPGPEDDAFAEELVAALAGCGSARVAAAQG